MVQSPEGGSENVTGPGPRLVFFGSGGETVLSSMFIISKR